MTDKEKAVLVWLLNNSFATCREISAGTRSAFGKANSEDRQTEVRAILAQFVQQGTVQMWAQKPHARFNVPVTKMDHARQLVA